MSNRIHWLLFPYWHYLLTFVFDPVCAWIPPTHQCRTNNWSIVLSNFLISIPSSTPLSWTRGRTESTVEATGSTTRPRWHLEMAIQVSDRKLNEERLIFDCGSIQIELFFYTASHIWPYAHLASHDWLGDFLLITYPATVAPRFSSTFETTGTPA